MSDTTKITEAQAICLVIADTDAADFVDIVNEVRTRFQLKVTSAQVEQVVLDLKNKQREIAPVSRDSRVNLELTAKLPVEDTRVGEVQSPTTGGTRPSESHPNDDLGHALHFVKAVKGLDNAKRLLQELESLLYS